MHSQGHPPPQGDPQLWPLCLVLSGFPSQLSPSSSSSSSSAQLPPPLRAGSCQPHTGIKAPVTDRRGDASAAPTLQGDPRGSGPVPTTDHPHPAPSPEGGAQKTGCPLQNPGAVASPAPLAGRRTLVSRLPAAWHHHTPRVAGGREGGDGPPGSPLSSGRNVHPWPGWANGVPSCWGESTDARVLRGVLLMDGSVQGGLKAGGAERHP